MKKIKLIYGDKREEMCLLSTLPDIGHVLMIDGLTYHVLNIAKALNNTDPDGPEAIVTLSAGSHEPPDNRIPVIQPKFHR
ncbi:hypothetical protein ADIMK_2971 [Marinobacterium lacunae]|uniref:Uncharacterized protein n=1 Tax=Marinobacterium lacunae TaxID=1232683 RepID=A0A081FWF7_9GAMM|nr:hypothetical protein [Marinobacterium lacunae]KEA62862.1 hypothetical protein ADIMK_2971 [Marinobacterium lacunae]